MASQHTLDHGFDKSQLFHEALWKRLEDNLLRIGGTAVVRPKHEPDLSRLVTEGASFDCPVTMRPGQTPQCHMNSAMLYAQDTGAYKLATGYALSEDGTWRQHSWVMRDNGICETTAEQRRYFGIVLTASEAGEFWFSNFLHHRLSIAQALAGGLQQGASEAKHPPASSGVRSESTSGGIDGEVGPTPSGLRDAETPGDSDQEPAAARARQPSNPTPMTPGSGGDERATTVDAKPTCAKAAPKKVPLKVGHWEDDVDIEIAPLIREIWKAGIYTPDSGQEDGDGCIWVGFESEECMRKFLDIVILYEEAEDSIYRRSVGETTCPDIMRWWSFEIYVFDYGLNYEVDEAGNARTWHDAEEGFGVEYRVRFPRSDKNLVLKRLRRHNWAKEGEPEGDGRAEAPPDKEPERGQAPTPVPAEAKAAPETALDAAK